VTFSTPRRWQPARLRRNDLTLISLLLLTTALSRGLDYLTGTDSNARGPKPGVPSVLVGIEAAFPLHWWGAAIVIGVALLVVGMGRRWHFPVWAGHVVLSAIYAALCIGLLAGYLERPWLDGIRGATGLILPFGLHTLIWWRMGPRPVLETRSLDDHRS
jgi:hypothetical protein